MLDNIHKYLCERKFNKILNKFLEHDNRNAENFYQNSMTIITNKKVYDEIEKAKLKLYNTNQAQKKCLKLYKPNIVKH